MGDADMHCVKTKNKIAKHSIVVFVVLLGWSLSK